MCQCLGVKRANYYRWLHHERSQFDKRWDPLIETVRAYHETYDHKLGYRMMKDYINHDKGTAYTEYQVYKVMRYLGIKSRIRQKRHSCTVRAKDAKAAPNVLNRDFNAAIPNEKWVTDVTEFKYGDRFEHKLYLSVILDLYDRFPISKKYGDSNNNVLVHNTFDKAVEVYPKAHPLFHSDAGFQYTSPSFQNKLREHGMIQSMSRIGCCIDNGPMEGFWGILKCEMYYGKHYRTKEELIHALEEWFHYYTYERYQRRFGVRTPYEVRSEALKAETPAEYKIHENKRIMKYKQEHYKSQQAEI